MTLLRGFVTTVSRAASAFVEALDTLDGSFMQRNLLRRQPTPGKRVWDNNASQQGRVIFRFAGVPRILMFTTVHKIVISPQMDTSGLQWTGIARELARETAQISKFQSRPSLGHVDRG